MVPAAARFVSLCPPAEVRLVPGPCYDAGRVSAAAATWGAHGPVRRTGTLVEEAPGLVGVGVEGVCVGYLPGPVPGPLLHDIAALRAQGAGALVEVTITAGTSPVVTAHLGSHGLVQPGPSASAFLRGAAQVGHELMERRAARKTSGLTRIPRGAVEWRLGRKLRQGANFVDEHKHLSLYVMEKHHRAICKLVAAHGHLIQTQRGKSGVFAAWAQVQAEPRNRYDPEAVRAVVEGAPIAYFSLEWKDAARRMVADAKGKVVVVPVVVRMRHEDRYKVWVCQSITEAQEYAEWLHDEDLGEGPQTSPVGEG